MAFGPDGGLWMPEVTGNALLRVDPADGIEEFPLFGLGGLLTTVEADLLHGSLGNPLPPPGPITQGSDGEMYFALSFPAAAGLGNQIGRIDPVTHEAAVWQTPSSASYPCDVQAEQPGSIWVGELAPNKVGRLAFG